MKQQRKKSKPSDDPQLDAIAAKMLGEFVIEANENLENAESALVSLDKDLSNSMLVDEIFRYIHTVKGTAAYLNLPDIKSLSHAYETLLGLIRDQVQLLTSAHVELSFHVVDALKVLVQSVQKPGGATLASFPSVIHAIEDEVRKLQGGHGQNLTSATVKKPKSTTEDVFRHTLQQQIQALTTYLQTIIDAKFHCTPQQIQNIGRSLETLMNAFDFIDDQGMVQTIETLQKSFAKEIQGDLISEKAAMDLRALVEIVQNSLVAKTEDAGVDPAAEKEELPDASIEAEIEATRKEAVSSTNTLRVDGQHIERLMNLDGELVIAKNALEHVQQIIEKQTKSLPEIHKDLRLVSAHVSHISGELQQTVRQLRLIPVKSVFQRFHRLIRELNQQTGKEVELFLEGEETQIDKKIAEEITEPLVHIIRNSVDHGIESQDERKRFKKPTLGQIFIRAFQRNQNIVIEIQDDGRGMDHESVLQKAIDKNLISEAEGKNLSRQQIIELIFLPGFSTAAAVTEISGRGVGMDVVRTKVAGLNGRVDIQTEIGHGSCISLELPLTTSVAESLLLKTHEQIYALPIKYVAEIIKVPTQDIKSMVHQRIISLRGQIIVVTSLAEAVGEKDDSSHDRNLERVSIVILRNGASQLGLIVDGVNQKEEIVTRPLPESMRNLTAVAGVSVLGDGKPIFILDPVKLMDSVVGRESKNFAQKESVA